MEVPLEAVAKAFQVILDFPEGAAFGQCFLHIPAQHIPVGFLAGLVDPIFFLLALGVEIAVFQY